MNGNNLQPTSGFHVRPAGNASMSHPAERFPTQARQVGPGSNRETHSASAAMGYGTARADDLREVRDCRFRPPSDCTGDRLRILPLPPYANTNPFVEVIKVLVGMLAQLIGLITSRLTGGSVGAPGVTALGSDTAVSGAGGQATTAASGTQKESGSWFDKIGEILGGIGDVFGGVKDLFGLGKEKSDAIESKKEAGGSSIWGDLLGIGAGMLLGRSGGLKKVGTAVSGVAKKAGSWIMESAGGLIKKGISWFSGLFA